MGGVQSTGRGRRYVTGKKRGERQRAKAASRLGEKVAAARGLLIFALHDVLLAEPGNKNNATNRSNLRSGHQPDIYIRNALN